MTITLNHTIVHCRDAEQSTTFLTELFDLPAPTRFGHFHVVEVANGVSLDYSGGNDEIAMQHYAFLVSEDDFTAIYSRIVERGIDHWADPGQQKSGEINTHDDGRGVYFSDPDGHLLEIITKPYGG